MVEITNNTQSEASLFVRTRALHCRVRATRNIGEYKVEPDGKGFPLHVGKVARRVRFVLMGQKIWAICADWNSGEFCRANKFGQPACCHVVAALNKVERNLQRQQHRAA